MMTLRQFLVQLGIEHPQVVLVRKDLRDTGIARGLNNLRDSVADEFVVFLDHDITTTCYPLYDYYSAHHPTKQPQKCPSQLF